MASLPILLTYTQKSQEKSMCIAFQEYLCGETLQQRNNYYYIRPHKLGKSLFEKLNHPTTYNTMRW